MEAPMGSVIFISMTLEEAREQLDEILSTLGPIDRAEALSTAGLLSVEEEAQLDRAQNLVWLLDQ